MRRTAWLVLLPIGVIAACDAGPGTGSTTTAGAAPEPSSVAARPRYADCGDDFSVSLDAMGPPSAERQCFVAANQAAKPAEVLVLDVEEGRSIYRTNPDRSVDVYLPGGRAGDPPWQVYHCTGIALDERRVFTLVDCGDPVELD